MKKYWVVFKNSWQRELEYRLDFFLGRLRSIVVLLLLYFVWTSLAGNSGRFAGYSGAELVTYVFLANILRQVVFGARSTRTAQEINDGTFSVYLVKPVNHFWYVFWSEAAQRSANFLAAIIEIAAFIFLFKASFILQTNWQALILFTAAVILALFLYFLLSYLVSLIAFWSREAMGPRFLFEWFLEFASGAYFPLNILSGVFYVFLIFLPFAYLIYFPISIYLGRLEFWQILTGISIQLLFVAVIGFFTVFVRKKGLKRYSSEGI